MELFLSLSRQTQVDDDTQLQEFVIGSTNFIEAQAVALLASQLSSDTVGVLWSGVTSERDRAVDVFMFSRFIRTGSTFSRLRERACEILDRLRTSGCGVLIAAGDAKVGAELAKCLDQMKWSVPLVGFSDWNRGERLVRASGPLYCVDVFSPDEVGQVAFVEEFIARHGSVPCTLAALGADAVSLAIYARKLDRVSQLRGPLFRPPEFITGPFDFDSRRIAARRSMAAIRLGPETSEFVQRLAVPI